MTKVQEYRNFVDFTKSQVEIGACTKEEAVYAILNKAQEIMESLKITPEEDNMYQAYNYN